MNRFDDAASKGPSNVPEASVNSDSSETDYSALTLDVGLYQDYLDDPSLSEEDKCELIAALWSIVVSFVDLGFGIHPLQQAQKDGGACGQDNTIDQIAATVAGSSVVQSTPCTTDINGSRPPARKEPM